MLHQLIQSRIRIVDQQVDCVNYLTKIVGWDIGCHADRDPVVLNQLYSYSQMQDTVGVIMLALVDGIPKVMPLKEMLTHYIDFQGEAFDQSGKFLFDFDLLHTGQPPKLHGNDRRRLYIGDPKPGNQVDLGIVSAT